MLRLDLAAAEIAHERDGAVDRFSFIPLLPGHEVDHVRQVESRCDGGRPIVSEALLQRYTKISQAAITNLIEAVLVPRLPLKIVG